MSGQRAVFCDFDGTLAAIVPRPEDALPVAGAVDALADLADAGVTVGVVSGRPAEFLQAVIGLGALTYVGLHGLERAEGLEHPRPVPAVAGLLDDLNAIRAELMAAATEMLQPDVDIEDKRFAITLHYRNAPDPDSDATRNAVRDVARAATCNRAFVVQAGRKCWEILPDLSIDKGSAVLDEATASGAAFVTFVGDDIGDVHAFDALDRLASRGVVVTRVAVVSRESPPELLVRADVKLKDPPAVVAYLRALA